MELEMARHMVAKFTLMNVRMAQGSHVFLMSASNLSLGRKRIKVMVKAV